MSSNDFITQAIDYSISVSTGDYGYELPHDLVVDGNFHSYSGKPGCKRDDKEVYAATQYDSGHMLVTFWSWTNAEQKHVYRSWNESQLSADELKRIREESKRHANMVNQLCEEKYEVAAKDARKHWDAATPCTTHPYLEKKGVKSHGLRSLEGKLVIPIYDAETDALQSLQFIWPDGKKRFLTGGKVKNGYFRIGEGKKPFLGEGYATAATAFEATGKSSIFAVSAAQCAPAALHLRNRNKLTTTRLLHDIGKAGDAVADQWKKHDLGDVCTPNWGGHDIPEKANDWNDLAVNIGLEEVKRQLAPKSFQCFEAGEFLSMPCPPVEWSVDQRIMKGSTTVFYAMPGVGKSLLTMHLAVSSQFGLSILDGRSTLKQNVLLIDAELPQSLLNQRLKETYQAWKNCIGSKKEMRNLNPAKLHILPWLMLEEDSPVSLNLFKADAQAYLDPLIEKNDLIILDNFDKVTSRTAERPDARSDESEWEKMFSWARRWRSKGKTIIIVAHCNKSGALRGSGKISDDVCNKFWLRKINHQLLPSTYQNKLSIHVSPVKVRAAKPESEIPFSISLMEESDINSMRLVNGPDSVAQPWRLISDCELNAAAKEAKSAVAEADITKLFV